MLHQQKSNWAYSRTELIKNNHKKLAIFRLNCENIDNIITFEPYNTIPVVAAIFLF